MQEGFLHWALGAKPQFNISPYWQPLLRTPIFMSLSVYQAQHRWTSLCPGKGPGFPPVPACTQGEGWCYQKLMEGRRCWPKMTAPSFSISVGLLCAVSVSSRPRQYQVLAEDMPCGSVKGKTVLTLVKLVRETLFRTMAIGESNWAQL